VRVDSEQLSDLARSPLLGEYRGIMNLCRCAVLLGVNGVAAVPVAVVDVPVQAWSASL
jgi:hypothetical protein